MKTTLDCVARITLFSAFLYVLNEGQFSSAKTVIAYYSTFLVLLGYNAIFNKREKQWTRRNMIGNPLHSSTLTRPTYIDNIWDEVTFWSL